MLMHFNMCSIYSLHLFIIWFIVNNYDLEILLRENTIHHLTSRGRRGAWRERFEEGGLRFCIWTLLQKMAFSADHKFKDIRAGFSLLAVQPEIIISHFDDPRMTKQTDEAKWYSKGEIYKVFLAPSRTAG